MDAAGHQAILDRRLGVQFVHQEQANHQQQQGDGDAGQARRLPVGGLLVFLDQPGTLLLHRGAFYRRTGAECKSRLR